MVQNNKQTVSVIANIDNIKQINYAAIYKVIEKHTPISRVKIANISKLAPASVTKITRQLLENGIIRETARQASTGGRSAISLAPNDSSIHVLAIKIGRNLLSISRYDLSGRELANEKDSLESTNHEHLIELLTSKIALIIDNKKQFSEKISAISITMAGLINPKQGTIIYSSRYSFNNFSLVEYIEKKFNIPTFIANHTRALALAEHYFGASRNCLDSILLSIHHGVGSGIIIQGKCLLGENCNIGEIGHIQANPAGKQCHCGNFGCLETEINDNVIVEKVQSALNYGGLTCITPETLTIENIYQAAANRDPLCQKIVEDAATYLGKTIAVLVNILNPEKIIIAGKITASGDTLFSIIQQCVAHQTLPKFQNKLSIVPTELQQNSTIAAFSLIKEAIYEGDLLQKIRL
ncbi:ROK family protein [Psychromonas antarctica]|uniref:ROK family protein n=1 Tax=Psychromonas antarctica TaxID=67573 RepID=UPI001EE94E03|nr:ROK family protein [Psychromonas antarctica]MCG6200293.1 ROK family protein [Psychromonas antarctica]